MSEQPGARPVITWIADNDLSTSLHAATWLETTRYLREFGWEVELISHGKPAGQREVRGVLVRFFTKPNLFFVQQFFYHLKIFRHVLGRKDQSQLLLFHEISGLWMMLFKSLTWLMPNRQFIFVMDTRTLPMEPEDTLTLRAKLRRKYLEFMERNGEKWFDGRMAITPAMAEALQISPEKLWAIWPSGVDPEVFSTCSQEREYPKADEPIRLIYIGCMHVERNLMAMSRAVVQANWDGQHFQLVLVGDGNQFDELAAFAAAHPMDVQVYPPVPQSEIPEWLAAAHVGILPFPDEEKFRVSSPIKLFEYMAAGMPILATKIRCHTDVIQDDAAFVFWAEGSDENALLSVLQTIIDKRGQLEAMGAFSRLNISDWSWRASAKKIDIGLRKQLALGEDDQDG